MVLIRRAHVRRVPMMLMGTRTNLLLRRRPAPLTLTLTLTLVLVLMALRILLHPLPKPKGHLLQYTRASRVISSTSTSPGAGLFQPGSATHALARMAPLAQLVEHAPAMRVRVLLVVAVAWLHHLFDAAVSAVVRRVPSRCEPPCVAWLQRVFELVEEGSVSGSGLWIQVSQSVSESVGWPGE